MPSELPRDAIERADAAVVFAQQVRKFHRRRTDRNAEQRVRDIETALECLRDAMKPLRSAIGGFASGPQSVHAEQRQRPVQDASAAIQRERRKLWKMRGQKK